MRVTPRKFRYPLLLAGLLIPLTLANAGRYPQEYRWQEYRSGGLTVIAPVGYEGYARYLLDRAEVYLDSLELWYGVRPPHTSLILNPSEDVGTDLATVQPSRVELTLTPSMDKGIRPQAGLFLDRVTGHELTHIVQFSTHAGVSRFARWMFGDAIAPLGIAPDWQVEGQAIWTESRAGGGRLNSSWHRMLWRTPLLEGKPWSSAQIAHAGQVAPPIGRAYVSGAFLYADLIEHWGGTKAASSWMRSRAAWPTLHSIPFRRAYGISMPSLYKGFVENETLRTERMTARRMLQPNGRILASAPRTDWRSPVWNSGTLFARRETYDDPSTLVAIDNAGHETTVAKLSYSPHRGITPFRNGVLLSENRRVSGVQDGSHVFLVYVDGSGRHHELASGPVRGWAPDVCAATSQLAWVVRAEDGAMELRVAELDGRGRIAGPIETLYRSPLGVVNDPAWSLDGRALAFVVDEGSGESIYLWREGGPLQRISIANAAATLDPAWAPNDRLWVSADPEGVFDLYEIDLSDSSALRQTHVATGAHEAAPAETGVVYLHYTSTGFQLVDLPSSSQEQEQAEVRVEAAPEATKVKWSREAESTPARHYNPLRYTMPIFWLPLYSSSDGSAGATLLGRDPLGFLTWRTTLWYGDGSEKPEGTFSLSYAQRLTEWTAEIRHENLYQTAFLFNSISNTVEQVANWQTRLEGSLIAQRAYDFDGGGYWSSMVPWMGYVTRERYVYQGYATPTEIFVDAKPIRYHGLLGGVSFSRSRSSARDPVARRLIAVSLDGERSRQFDRKLDGSTIRLQSRLHLPTPVSHLVAGVTVNGQLQQGDLSYSRSTVLPVGYAEHDLLNRFRSDGAILRGGTELHFPLLYPDWGYGQGWLHVNKVRGQFFAQMVFGENRSGGMDSGLLSVGGEIVLEGWALYDASVELRGGIAYMKDRGEVTSWVTLNAPFDLITGFRKVMHRWQRWAPGGGEAIPW